ncbi:trifunctional serine/threonine-protein kinase/ATP-binding protein/sensor histidine kinase [Calothrix sp. NIES-2098]|uniref:trifunctional serine/threonine-protein kinase/ATP-binding protein/sensor histidine kinase n=1 Tax=Calothrix sp. NIES-2098 TaxID=1954171 RepID=UPI000B618EA0|nr:serine/threonine protein kinase with two-component sensor domain [Calothrix sp. NIES-2098]
MNIAVEPLTKILGYRISERLYAGSRTLVYRAIREADQLPIVIKLLKQEYPTFNELLQFRNQYTIVQNLDFEGIVRLYSLEPYHNSYALVMEDFGGISLREWIHKEINSNLDRLKAFLEIAIALATILDRLYRHRIIHKDIKPANILINPDTQQVKLIDFSLASLLSRETQEIYSPNVLEGTLAYVSPEQTGRMNRGIDYRSDFYSLGVTFFEILTGELPFQSNDPMELVHCHIAKQPDKFKIQNSKFKNEQPIPPVFCDIVMKLMAKNAEDRYQSALGLKHDLEICLNQLQTTGQIDSFEIGQRDVCDRFIISEKLYGRYSEVASLLAAFERVARARSELMLVAGFSGIGKTAAINEVHKPIVRQRGYFIKGKFDQFQRNIPLSAFLQAFRDLIEQLLSETDTQLAQWQNKILSALGENAQVIIEVIPELERIIGKQPAVPELSGSAAQNRFNILFQKFIQVFATKDRCLTIFIDDLQWADAASLKFMQLLMSDIDSRYLLLIGAYRDNEVSATHPLMLTLEEIQKSQTTVNTITLAPLDLLSVNQLIADTFSCSLELALPLTELIFSKTKGNPFFTTQFLKALYEERLIAFNFHGGYWECNIAQVRSLTLSDDVVDFMAVQLQKLPPATQEVLQLAACIGNTFDLETLAIVYEQSPTQTANDLWTALSEGLILPQNHVYKFFQQEIFLSDRELLLNGQSRKMTTSYKFLHDRVQQAAYSLIPQDQKQATHLKIGRRLLDNTPAADQHEKIFNIINHLNLGAELIAHPREREQLANLNLIAGRQAKSATAYEAALKYFNTGIMFLEAHSWQTQYDLTLSLYLAAAEAEYLNTNYQQADRQIETLLENVKDRLQKARVYEIKIQSLISQNRMQSAVDLALEVLQMLGVSLDQQAIATLDIEALIDLPEMTDLNKLAALRILMTVGPAVFLANPQMYASVVFTMANLCMRYGNSSLAAYAYVAYGLLLCSGGDIESGYKFGQIAIELLDRFDSRKLKSKVYMLFYGSILHWKAHFQNSLQPLQEAFQLGLETGDLEFAAYSATTYCDFCFHTESELETVLHKQTQYVETIQKLKQEYQLIQGQISRQFLLNLSGQAIDKLRLVGDSCNETEMLPIWTQHNVGFILFFVYLYKLILAYFFGANADAVENLRLAEPYQNGTRNTVHFVEYQLYSSLSLLAHYPDVSIGEQQQYLQQVAENQALMQQWATHAPMNYQHMWCLVEAERNRVLGNKATAIEMYDQAIESAKQHSYIQQEALANELAAKFYLNWGKQQLAQTYAIEAYYCYTRWGAKAKVTDLETRYPQLLAPILEQGSFAFSTHETIIVSGRGSSHSSSSGSSTASVALDLAVILKASQTLSSEIELEKLVSSLLHVALENAGADKCVLLLSENGRLLVQAIANIDNSTTLLHPQPMEESLEIPLNLINMVKRSLQPLVIVDATVHPRAMDDPYIRQHQPRSILCSPILHQGKLLGILYLENDRSIGAFTDDRVDILNLLCTQAAISLENARLYQKSLLYGQQLERSLQEVQQMQLQLVQSEKMSALGNLVAGVAHEINNPVGFISGNIEPAKNYVQDLLGLINLYQEKFPDPGVEIEDEIEAIDLDYLREDLPQLLESMSLGANRIRSISISLRTFSRTDKDYKVPFNIHDGIDSTILILRHRLKGNELRPAIEVIKNYGALPLVDCFAGQLNQVFMNLLANAIDALEESNLGKSMAEIAAKPNRITIQTCVAQSVQHVEIRIADNGVGMSQEVKQRVFDHLFTTKAVGKGTGLGLAIARQIVVEAHGGTIEVDVIPQEKTEFVVMLPIKV